MASANPSSARLSRSTGDLSGVNHSRTPGTSTSRVDGGKGTLPQAKIQALEQFIKFGRKGKQKDNDKSNQKAADFPPPAWFDSTPISTTSASPATANTAPNTAARAVPRRVDSSPLPPPSTPQQRPSRTGSTRPSHAIAQDASRRVNADVPSAAVAPSGTAHSPALQRRGSFPNPGSLDGGDVTPPEPLTLAKRIQAMLSPQTSHQASTPSATDATTSSGAPQSETAGPATPGGSMAPGDSRFLALLGNPNVMSGSLEKGRQSVFAILDRLRRPSAHGTEAPAGTTPSSTPGNEYDGDDREGDDSIMLYAPLVPSEDSEVELAASDITSVFDDGETLEYEQPARPLSFAQAGEQITPRSDYRTLPPEIPGRSTQDDGQADASQSDTGKEPSGAGWFDTLKEKVVEGGKLVSDKVAEGTKSLKGKAGDGRKIVKTTTRWVPSPDKISFQATWWGYRLYLPPPILDVLDNRRLEAAKRAAIITTALQWLLGHVPLTLVPPQFRAGVLITRRLAPYLGYIGGFIAWSWGAMRSFDKGQGIVLTATWLLPVALIPGTWEAKDTSQRPLSPAPATSARSRLDA